MNLAISDKVMRMKRMGIVCRGKVVIQDEKRRAIMRYRTPKDKFYDFLKIH